jgi:hypothetical protein
LLYLNDEVRIDFPVWTINPGHMGGIRGVSDEKKLDFAAHVDEYRARVVF